MKTWKHWKNDMDILAVGPDGRNPVAKILEQGEQGERIAALIAAAPDLLAALEAILPEFEMLYEDFDPDGQLGAWIEWSVMAQNAIAKAKGSAS